jgi:putative transcriptional regulator
MTEEEVEAAAYSDPDALPMTEEELQKARRVPRVKTLRRALHLTQEEFALCYRIPLGTLRDWEQGRSEPDQAACAYLRVIAANPEMVRYALQVEQHLRRSMLRVKDWNDPIHPGEILASELEYIGVTAATLAERIGVPRDHIDNIISEQCDITADTAIRLGIFFQQTPDFWLNLQKSYELDVARRRIGDNVKNILPYQPTGPSSAQTNT